MRIILFLSLALLLLNGCSTGPTKPDPEQVAAAESARDKMAAGDYAGAARQFMQLAEDTRGALATGYRMAAAEAYFQAGDRQQTRTLLKTIQPKAEEQPVLRVRKQLLAARLALADNNAVQALEQLQVAYPSESQPQLQADSHLLRARAYEQQGRMVDAAAARLAADMRLRGQPNRSAHIEPLWQTLRQLERDQLTQLQQGAQGAAAGWLELALIEKADLTDPANLRRTLDDWQLQYPNHPAANSILPQLRDFAQSINQAPQQISVILPFSSAYSEAARIIRDGLMAAWYQDNNARPRLRFYDAGQKNIVSVYNQAVSDGADMIVGPLQKEAINSLVEQDSITLPTLALNEYEGDPAALQALNQKQRLPLLYQFGLSPEAEAKQLAERAWFDGYAHALAMTPANEWGKRMYQAFSETFKKLGGKLLEHTTFHPGEQEFSAAVQTLLNIDNSEQRYKALRDQLQRSLQSEPRRRQDADFIMLASYPAAGRQLGPQLKFHRADKLPVYATSHIYGGTMDRSANTDMNGIIFADMPWILNQGRTSPSIYQTIKNYWPDRLENSPRLYALGLDAYHLTSRLGRMSLDVNSRYAGVTGRLSVTPGGNIQRQLIWAQFTGGIPRILDDGKMAGRP